MNDELEQSTLSKAVKNVKQTLLKKQKKPETQIPIDAPIPQVEEVKLDRGVVYIGHIPHGFFEKEIFSFFKQFGKVTRVRVARSKKTGISRGYAFVEFLHSEVAKIAAESMNNYLMCGRLLKATYIPPEKQHSRYFAGQQWSKKSYPKIKAREITNRRKNTNVDNKVENVLVQRSLSKLANMEKKLEEAGIVYRIAPVETPKPTLIIKKRKATPSKPLLKAKKRKIVAQPPIGLKTEENIVPVEPSAKNDKKKKLVPPEQTKRKNKNKEIVSLQSLEKKIKPKATVSLQPSEKKVKQKATMTLEPSEKEIKKKEIAPLETSSKKNKKSEIVPVPIKKNKQKPVAPKSLIKKGKKKNPTT
ncbi:MKI67 FHA domain-interacting nucleolar phosphoprotein-like [Athalia rosae]|uniref:MKI67 FHA domain-interacting nucleolar phosphoprotein-like n=1 Tax=Athalia rosae TaxID=37344 RepID=UPI0020348385|nr:MKI67 FHA domain-interacting nucleolar phosphoprotein-like [Athalia rosae]